MSYIDPFLVNVPELDVHGYDRTGAVAEVKLFIDNYSMIKEKRLRVVHGNGEHILKKAIHEYLKKDKRVESFKLNNFNIGETIIYLK